MSEGDAGLADSPYVSTDKYINDLFAPNDPTLKSAEDKMAAAGLPEIQISRGQGKFLYLLSKMIGAKRVLEIGTLGGYSTIWLARSLPENGSIISLECDPHSATIAEDNIRAARISCEVEVRLGEALSLLPDIEMKEDPFDLVFLDADKTNYVNYLNFAVRMTRPGGLIIADNVIRGGNVLAPDTSDISAVGAAAFNKYLADEPKLEAIVLQQVGIKGHDGLAIARLRD